ncbi:MAG TPA: AMP-binding protein [Mycobacteriales bacterium]
MNLASVWETVADTVPDAEAVVGGGRRLTYRELDDQAARFAAALTAAGVQPDGKVALYLYNGPEYLVAQFGAYKVRAAAVNVNYRYLDEELRYLLDDSDSEVIVFHASLGDRVARVRDQLPKLRLLIEVDDGPGHVDGAERWEDLLAAHEPEPRRERSDDDPYMLYSGGTTGMPKGVLYRQGEFARNLYGNFALLGLPVETPTEIGQIPPFVQAMAGEQRITAVPCCPLMHGTGMWVAAMPALCSGGTVVLLSGRSFDPRELLRTVEAERVTRIVIVGDAFARPILREIEEAEAAGHPYDLSSVTGIVSSGAMWSQEVKDGLTARMDAIMMDALGSSEGGGYGVNAAAKGQSAPTAKFDLVPGTKVLAEDGHEVAPGSDEQGLLATPTAAYGYYKDPEKTARTFRQVDGVGYVLTGDWATVASDGSITLLGRGSNCINTGGEKVFPEEVEEALKRHPAVADCLVVGQPDERLGQQIVAVVGLEPDAEGPAPTSDELRTWLRGALSGYKIPRSVTVLDAVRRAPNGKADYDWARTVTRSAAS